MSRKKSLSRELLEQARHLANRNAKRPRQADLRRGVSSAYYSLFHFLIDEACRSLLGTSQDGEELRVILARAFSHGAMATVSRKFHGGTLPDLLKIYPGPVPKPLSAISGLFVELQAERHVADYDVGATFLPSEVNHHVDRVEAAIADWKTIRDDPTTRLFLLSLLVWDRIKDK